MAMLMDRKVVIPKSAVLMKLQHRPCRGKDQTTSVGKSEGKAWSKDKRDYKLPTVRAGLTDLVPY